MNDYAHIVQAIAYIIANRCPQQPALNKIADHIGLPTAHFKRLLKRWGGMSPEYFLQTQTAKHIKTLLNNTGSVSHVKNKSSQSKPFVSIEPMPPDEYTAQGMTINYGIHKTPFGEALIAVTRENNICQLFFITHTHLEAVSKINKQWPSATLYHSEKETKPLIAHLFNQPSSKPLCLYVKGTDFQITVWQTLLEVQQGQLSTYGQIAKRIGNSNASRAVGGALRANPIAFFIPCHRIVPTAGGFGDYRWGQLRKRAILSWETAPIEKKLIK